MCGEGFGVSGVAVGGLGGLEDLGTWDYKETHKSASIENIESNRAESEEEEKRSL